MIFLRSHNLCFQLQLYTYLFVCECKDTYLRFEVLKKWLLSPIRPFLFPFPSKIKNSQNTDVPRKFVTPPWILSQLMREGGRGTPTFVWSPFLANCLHFDRKSTRLHNYLYFYILHILDSLFFLLISFIYYLIFLFFSFFSFNHFIFKFLHFDLFTFFILLKFNY